MTHIDSDHIDGIVRLLQDAERLACRFERIWFNGPAQLNQVPDEITDELGATQGEYLSLLIDATEEREGRSLWNRDFPGEFVALDRRQPELPVIELPGNLVLTLLSPDHQRLVELRDSWDQELERLEIASGDERTLRRMLEDSKRLRPLGDVLGDDEADDFEPIDQAAPLPDELGGDEMKLGSDDSPANGSSIALLAEHDGKRFLFAGDAWPSVLERSIATLVGQGKRLPLTGFNSPTTEAWATSANRS